MTIAVPLAVPENHNIARRLQLTSLLLFFLLAIVALSVALVPQGNTLDYPISLLSAQRTLAGQKPYADFSVLYGPLSHYFAALWLFCLPFLEPATAINLLFAASTLVYLAILFAYARSTRALDSPFGLCLISYTLFTTPLIAQLSYYSLLPMLCVLFAVCAARKAFDPRVPLHHRKIAEAILAVLAVVGTLARLNFGLYLFFAFALTCIAALLLRRPDTRSTLLRVIAWTILFFAVAALILHLLGILQPYLSDMRIYLPRFKSRTLPLSLISKTLLVRFALLILATFFLTIFAIRKRFSGGVLFACFLLIPLLHYLGTRFDSVHLLPLLTLSPLLFILILREHPPATKTSPIGAILFLALLFLPAIFYYRQPFTALYETAHYLSTGRSANPEMIARAGIFLNKNEAAMLDSLQTKLAAGEIYWGGFPGSCESTTHVGVNMALYVAAHRLPTARLWFWDTPSTVFPDVQEKIVTELSERKTPWIGVQGLIDPSLGFVPGNPHESPLFFEFVQSHYQLTQTITLPEQNRFYRLYHLASTP